jgi:hypothetical protein
MSGCVITPSVHIPLDRLNIAQAQAVKADTLSKANHHERHSGRISMNFLRRLNPRNSILALFVYSALLVLGTYNPSGVSVWHWIRQATDWRGMWPVYVVVGLLLIGLWLLFLTSIRKSMSLGGISLIVLIVALLCYLPVHFDTMNVTQSSLTWLALCGLIVVVGFGGSFARIRFYLFGQRSVDTVHGDTVEIEHPSA